MRTFCTLLAFVLLSSSLLSQTRVAVLPIRNMDGDMSYNKYCYTIADSIRSVLSSNPDNGKTFYIVPVDSVENLLATLNIEPNNPQYESDVWKTVALLNCSKVVTGSFNLQSGRMLLNVYCYNVENKLPDPNNAAKNIFKAPEKIFESVQIVCKKIAPSLSLP